MTYLVGTMNCLASNTGYENEADALSPLFLHLIKSKNISLLNINGKSKTNGSQTLHLRLSSENVPLHVDVCIGKLMLSRKRGSLLSSFTNLNLNFGSVIMPKANCIELEDLNPFSFVYKR